MTRKVVTEFIGDTTGFTKAVEDAGATAGKFGAIIQGIGQGLGQAAFSGLEDGLHDVGSFIGNAIDQADLLNTSIVKSDTVFGDSVGVIDDWANNAAESIGMSATAALSAADAVGSLGISAGLTQAKAAALSKGVVNLAADLGSFNHMSSSDALSALQSGLEGSTKSLKSLGIVMTDQDVQQQAMLDGAVKVNGAYTDAALIQARYEVILQKSSLASGDFATNTDNLGNAQARANAELENAQAELGQHFLPVQIAVTNAQNDFFKGLGVVNNMLGNFGNMLNGSYKSVNIFAEQTPIATDAVQGLGIQLDMTSANAGKARDDIGGFAKAVDSLASSFLTDAEKMDDSMGEMFKYFEDKFSALESLSNDAADAIYGPQIRASDLAATKREEADERAIISSKKSTAAQVADAQARLLELEKVEEQQEIDMAGRGELTETQYAALIAQLDKQAKSANAEVAAAAKAALAQLKALQDYADNMTLSNYGNSGAPTKGPKHNAGGGPLDAGDVSWVGEAGPELFVPNTSGHIIPNNQIGMSGGGQPFVFHNHIYLDGQQIIETTDRGIYNHGAIYGGTPALHNGAAR